LFFWGEVSSGPDGDKPATGAGLPVVIGKKDVKAVSGMDYAVFRIPRSNSSNAVARVDFR
jgi:hypothetical protein